MIVVWYSYFSKASSTILSGDEGISTLTRLEQFLKARSPIALTEDDILMEVSDGQRKKALFSVISTEEGFSKLIALRDLQLKSTFTNGANWGYNGSERWATPEITILRLEWQEWQKIFIQKINAFLKLESSVKVIQSEKCNSCQSLTFCALSSLRTFNYDCPSSVKRIEWVTFWS